MSSRYPVAMASMRQPITCQPLREGGMTRISTGRVKSIISNPTPVGLPRLAMPPSTSRFPRSRGIQRNPAWRPSSIQVSAAATNVPSPIRTR